VANIDFGVKINVEKRRETISGATPCMVRIIVPKGQISGVKDGLVLHLVRDTSRPLASTFFAIQDGTTHLGSIAGCGMCPWRKRP
jgi:hypothetical protein